MSDYTEADFERARLYFIAEGAARRSRVGFDPMGVLDRLACEFASVRAEGRVQAVEDYARELPTHVDRAREAGCRAGLESLRNALGEEDLYKPSLNDWQDGWNAAVGRAIAATLDAIQALAAGKTNPGGPAPATEEDANEPQ